MCFTDTDYVSAPLTMEELRMVPEEVQNSIALLALNRWPGDYENQCQEMLWQLTAYCQVQKIRYCSASDESRQEKTKPADYVARLESLVRTTDFQPAIN